MLAADGMREQLRGVIDAFEARMQAGESASVALSAELRGLRERMGGMVKAFVRPEWLDFSAEQLIDFARYAAQNAIPEKDRIIVRRKTGSEKTM